MEKPQGLDENHLNFEVFLFIGNKLNIILKILKKILIDEHIKWINVTINISIVRIL